METKNPRVNPERQKENMQTTEKRPSLSHQGIERTTSYCAMTTYNAKLKPWNLKFKVLYISHRQLYTLGEMAVPGRSWPIN